MLLALFILVTLVAVYFLIFVYQMVMALSGTAFGIRVKEMCVGYGPTLHTTTFCEGNLKCKLIPIGGYTKFCDHEVQPGERCEGRFENAPVYQKLAILIAGPVSNLVLGALLLWIPCLVEHHQLVFDPADKVSSPRIETTSLRHLDTPSSFDAQTHLIVDSGATYIYRLVSFGDLEGWAGYLGFVWKAGHIGNRSALDWLTVMGVFAFCIGCFNLLPLPLLNGFSIVKTMLLDAIWDPRRHKGAYEFLYYLSLPIFVFLTARIIWLDLTWIWSSLG